jgi:hypothetical protein
MVMFSVQLHHIRECYRFVCLFVCWFDLGQRVQASRYLAISKYLAFHLLNNSHIPTNKVNLMTQVSSSIT